MIDPGNAEARTLGPLLIISGPSGSGKSTIVSRLTAMPDLRLRQSISATTRPKREGEQHGRHYYFLSDEDFRSKIDRGEFLEYAEVHGHKYGTLRELVDEWRRQGWAVVLVIDVQGAAQVRQCCPDAVSIFVKTSSLDMLEKRLRERQTETEESIQRRLANARKELARADEYDYQVVNDDLNQAVEQIRSIIMTHRREDVKNA
jgi:guanylate kinase